MSSFCVYYSNPLTATICLPSANTLIRGGEEKTFLLGFFYCSLHAFDAWWLLFKNSSRANFPPHGYFPPIEGSEKFASVLQAELKFAPGSVTGQTNDNRGCVHSITWSHDGPMRLFIFKFSSGTHCVVWSGELINFNFNLLCIHNAKWINFNNFSEQVRLGHVESSQVDGRLVAVFQYSL